MDRMDNVRERYEALEQQTEPLKHQTSAREAHPHTGEWRRRWWRSIVCGVMLLSLLGLAAASGKAEEVSLTPTAGGRYLPPGVLAPPGGFSEAGFVSVGQGQAGWFAFDLGLLAGARGHAMTFSFTQVLTINPQFFPLIINTYDVTTPFDRLIVDRSPLDAEGEQIAEDLHTGDVYASFVVTADGEGTRYDIALNNDAIGDLQAAINRGDQFFSIGLANASFNDIGFFTPSDATLKVSVIVFAGTPGAAPCPVPSSAYPTIQAAVDDVTCAAITGAAGTYTEHVVINRDVTIRGEDQERTIVDGGGFGRVFGIFSGVVTIKNVTIQNGFVAEGGGIGNFSTLTIKDSTIANNRSFVGDGGGIRNHGRLTIQDSIIADNSTAILDGGGIADFGTLTIQDSTIADNSASHDGGGIFNQGSVTLREVSLQNNTPNDCTGCP